MTATATSTTPKPMPIADEDSQPYFDGANRGVLMLLQCEACSAYHQPDAKFCSQCLGESLRWRGASGKGTLFTFGIVHQKLPGFENDTPYNVSVIQLPEGPRMTCNVIGCANEDLKVGMPLQVVFEDSGNGTPLPRFRPS